MNWVEMARVRIFTEDIWKVSGAAVVSHHYHYHYHHHYHYVDYNEHSARPEGQTLLGPAT